MLVCVTPALWVHINMSLFILIYHVKIVSRGLMHHLWEVQYVRPAHLGLLQINLEDQYVSPALQPPTVKQGLAFALSVMWATHVLDQPTRCHVPEARTVD